MDVRSLGLGVSEIVPVRYQDERGYLVETWQGRRFADASIGDQWVQENQSYSRHCKTLRGLHLQLPPYSQAKLVRVLRGSVLDIAVDVRTDSDTFGHWVSCVLSASALNQVYIPHGFAHGFITLEMDVEVLYKVTAPYAPDFERTIAWNDPDLAIDWKLASDELPILSAKDSCATSLAAFSVAG